MGPINWLAAGVAAALAFGVGLVWYGPMFGRAKLAELGPGGLAVRSHPARTSLITGALLLVSAAMLAHMFARLPAGDLAAKPWLYFMMSGGLAIAFVIPSLWISYAHQRISTRLAMIDAGYWIVAYLTMGLAFWVLS